LVSLASRSLAIAAAAALPAGRSRQAARRAAKDGKRIMAGERFWFRGNSAFRDRLSSGFVHSEPIWLNRVEICDDDSRWMDKRPCHRPQDKHSVLYPAAAPSFGSDRQQ